MNLRRNPKILIGVGVGLTANLLYMATLLTVDRLPRELQITFLVFIFVGGALTIAGVWEEAREKKLKTTHSIVIPPEPH